MEKQKYYPRTVFDASVIRQAHEKFLQSLPKDSEPDSPDDLSVHIDTETWSYDSIEEFLADYPKSHWFRFDHMVLPNRLIVSGRPPGETSVTVRMPNRALIEGVFHIFEVHAADSVIEAEEAEPLTVFIGHGRDDQWRDLKDHLHDLHNIDVVAYEVGPRAGLGVKEVLQQMIDESSFALLVLTGEDQHTDGELHARENVIHEVGLFQGTLGFERAIVLLEEGVTEFSNILGINQIRFPNGGIRETFGDVIATINREIQ